MPTSTKVKNLNINELTEAQYDAAVQGGVIGANELSVLTDVSYVEPSDLATVATTGDYSDLINRPTNLVSTNTAQTISGMKTFSGDITLSGTTSIKNNTGGTNYTMLYRDASTIHVGASTSALKLEGSGTRPAYNNDSLALLSDVTAELPSQTGHSGEFLTTDGTSVSWAAVSGGSLPSQTGNAGKFLTTDGTDASWSDKPLVNTATGNYSMCVGQTGSSASGTYSLAVGSLANSAQRSVAIGSGATTTANYTTAIGDQAGCYGGQGAVAIGSAARANAANAIQIAATNNVSVNSDTNTMKVANANGNFEMMSADGTIPTARLTKVNTAITLTAAGWSSNTQTVSVTGVSSTSVVFVAPDPADTTDYVSAGILCASQGTNSLTFTATTTPTSDIDVNVVCL